jgi:hypothetical protein
MIIDKELDDSVLKELTFYYTYISNEDSRHRLSSSIEKLKRTEIESRLIKNNIKGHFFKISSGAYFDINPADHPENGYSLANGLFFSEAQMTSDLYNWLYNVSNYLTHKKVNVRFSLICDADEEDVPFANEKINVQDLRKPGFCFQENVMTEIIGRKHRY